MKQQLIEKYTQGGIDDVSVIMERLAKKDKSLKKSYLGFYVLGYTQGLIQKGMPENTAHEIGDKVLDFYKLETLN